MASRLVEKVFLYYREGTKHDKVYNIELTEEEGGFRVTGYNGRRGAKLIAQSKTPHPVPYRTARYIFNHLESAKLNHRKTPYRVAKRETTTNVNEMMHDTKTTNQKTNGRQDAEDQQGYVAPFLDALEF